MEKTRGRVKINGSGKKFFRFVDIAFSHEDDEIYFKEVPILGDNKGLIEDSPHEMELVINDDIVWAKPIELEYPHNSYFPDLKVMNVNTGEIHKIWKFVIGNNGETSIWSYSWYGRHVVGIDCVFVKD